MSTCPRCQTEFTCCMSDAGDAKDAPPCWCTSLPPLPSESYQDAGCYCPQCLHALVEVAQRKN